MSFLLRFLHYSTLIYTYPEVSEDSMCRCRSHKATSCCCGGFVKRAAVPWCMTSAWARRNDLTATWYYESKHCRKPTLSAVKQACRLGF